MKQIRIELKEEYGHLSIEVLVRQLHDQITDLRYDQREVTRKLAHIRYEQRWTEIEYYRKRTFKDFLEGEFNYRLNTLQNNCLAWLGPYPEIAETYNPGLLPSIVRKCGKDKMSTVVKQIESKEKKKKRTLHRDEIEQIIQEHKKPKKPKPADIQRDYQRDYKILYEEAQDKVRELTSVIAKRDDQILKLKQRVKELEYIEDLKMAIEPYFSKRNLEGQGVHAP